MMCFSSSFTLRLLSVENRSLEDSAFVYHPVNEKRHKCVSAHASINLLLLSLFETLYTRKGTSGANKSCVNRSTSADFSLISLVHTSTFSLDLTYSSLVPLLPIHAACIDSAPRLICSSLTISALRVSILVWISALVMLVK